LYDVTNMEDMFHNATSFNQSLGWNGCSIALHNGMFNGTACEEDSCGVDEWSCPPTFSPSLKPTTSKSPTNSYYYYS